MLFKLGDFFARWRPVRVARIAVGYKRVGLQRCLEFFPSEPNGLVVIVRTVGIELHAVAHTSFGDTLPNPQNFRG